MTQPGETTVKLCFCLLLCLVGLAAALPSLAQPQPDDLNALRELFAKDPPAAFDKAERLFGAPKKQGDLDGMMAVIRVVEDFDNAITCFALLDGMAQAAIPVAQRAGKWEALGDLYACRIPGRKGPGPVWDILKYPDVGPASRPIWMARRAARFAHLAEEANARAGRPHFVPGDFAESCAALDAKLAVAQAAHAKERLSQLGPAYASRLTNIDDAAAAGDDAEATSGAVKLATELAAAPDARMGVWVLARLTDYCPMCGGARIVATAIQGMERHRPLGGSIPNGAVMATLINCTVAWTGRSDALRGAVQWCLRAFEAQDAFEPWATGALNGRLRQLRLDAEARQLARAFVGWRTRQPGTNDADFAASQFVRPDTDSRTRRLLVGWTCRGLVSLEAHVTLYTVANLIATLRQITAYAPDGQKAVWAYETALVLADTAPLLPNAPERPVALEEAAKYFEQGNRKDLADDARALAAALAKDDPAALLNCSLTSAQSAAAESRWDDAIKTLEPAIARQEPSVPLLQATLLLQQAYRKTAKAAQAEDALDRAWKLLGQVTASPAERANFAIALAAGTDDKTRKTFFLQAAQEAAQAPGLEFMQEGIAAQLADTALASGDMAAAQKALTDIVERNEAKRERLAFDPLLRQQWFADNIGPYRRLMRVAATRGDVNLALSVAERMRSRALLDQLAWQKVDIAVRLPDKLRNRLVALRTSRQQAYALLQAAMGGQGEEAPISAPAPAATGDAVPTTTDDDRGKYMPIRGQYMPIRGLYMPIRGPLDKGKPASTADVARLKDLLAKLATEETALESAIREAVPAYASASAAVPSGAMLAQAVGQQDDLALLHYTLCDDGLAVVAIGPGKAPRVARIAIKGDELWQCIGKFREAIWERKPEAFTQAAELYDTLIAPVEDTIGNAKRLWVVGDGALQLVPFGALMDKDKTFLAWKMAVANVPSLSLALSSRGDRGKATKPAVIVAAPDTGAIEDTPAATPDKVAQAPDDRGKYMPIRGMYMPVRGSYMPIRGDGGVSGALTAMAMVPLPGAKAEGEAVAGRLQGATLMTGKDATKARLLKEGGDADIVHIATHGFADPDFPDFSGVLLAGTDAEHPYDVLTAQEVYFWQLKARLVALSACQTALGKDVEGEGLLGLTRAFLYAGAKDVLCSLWPVSDDSTKVLMAWMYENLAKDMPVEVALQSAQKTLIGAEGTRHPFFWAGFIAVRGPQ